MSSFDDDTDDATLVRACLAGQRQPWRLLVRRYQRLVYAVARRAGHDEHAAADVFQTVFERLYEGLARIREPERLHAWIVTTAKRESLLLLRRARRQVSIETLRGDEESPEWDPPSDDPLPDALLSDLQQLHRLRQGLDRLDPRCHDLLLALFDDDDSGSSYAEIAQRLGMPVGSLGPTRARCLERLRRLVGGGR
jgi:RNA polymerase sigma factor (sigma-70 family)